MNGRTGSPETRQELRQQTKRDHKQAYERANLRVQVVHEAVRQEGAEELVRPAKALFWSALAAGLSMSFSCIGEAMLHAHLPRQPWTPLVTNLGYSLGFLIVILGRQQLFTENTVTVILPLMGDFRRTTVINVLRVWTTVLVGNLIGGVAIAWILYALPSLDQHVKHALGEMGHQAASLSFGTLFLRAIFAGWLIALLVWLLPSAESARLFLILIIAYVVALGHFAHVIVGTIETVYAAFAGQHGWGTVIFKFFPAALLGNILGGVALTAAINHAQTVAGDHVKTIADE